MAMIKCPECGKEISSSAINCPNCGCPIEGCNEASIRFDSLGSLVTQFANVYDADTNSFITETASGRIATIPVEQGKRNIIITTGGSLAPKRSPVFTLTGGKKYQAVWDSSPTIKRVVALNQVDSFSAVSTPVNTSSGGCYVATCVYGSYDCPQVWTLRRYRDYTLAETWYGRAFIRLYYAVSPTIVKWFGNTKWFKKMWKGKLDRMVKNLQSNGIEDTPYADIEW